jgi:1-acyl-sn-glycerol-3-phosphate acyltransferase
MRDALKAALGAAFRVLFTYECVGEENVPKQGPAVVAANHPSYLDPLLLSLGVSRRICFMAWDALFRVPLLGALMRAFGAFPVDIRPGRGGDAYRRAKSLVERGEVVGIFPEGKRSRTGWMEERLREGAARLAFETGAPLVPASIAGAFRAWPHYQSLPRPARIKVRFHEPIDPAPWRARPADEALPEMLAELRRRVDKSLLPGVKADLRLKLLWRLPAPWPRGYESLPALALALLLFWKTRSLAVIFPAYGYIAYLLLDHFVIPQSRPIKWLRSGSPVLFLLAYAGTALSVLGRPPVLAGEALVAALLGALFPYLYEHTLTALGFVRGLVWAMAFELGALYLAPTGLGPHVALPLFAAAYAWDRRSVFWRWSVPLLALWAFVLPFELGARFEIVPHAACALLAWSFVRLLPLRLHEAPLEARQEQQPGLGLNLRD